jgi:hypothetical protein
MADMGYDVSDYCDVDPMFGTLADFDAMVTEAHRLGIKVIIDQVISHTSDQHPWFVESRASRTNSKADWYVWADPKPDGTAPNNWLSIFGGPGWEWDGVRRQYYMHNFLTSQPDLNFHNPEVQDALLETVRFWLERGVDGFPARYGELLFPRQAAARAIRRWSRIERCRAGCAGPIPTACRTISTTRRSRKTSASCSASGAARPNMRPRNGRRSRRRRRSLKTVAAYTTGGDKLHMCYTFDLLGPDFTATHIRGCVDAFEGGGRRLGLLGVLQPRRHAPCQPLRENRAMSGCVIAKLGDLGARGAARLDLPLSGRGTGPAGGRACLRGPARSLWHPLLAGLQGPRRMPHADAVGGRHRYQPGSAGIYASKGWGDAAFRLQPDAAASGVCTAGRYVDRRKA